MSVKKCPKEYILDDRTQKCVKKKSVLGKRLLVRKYGCKYKKCSQKQFCNPTSKRCVSRTSRLGKKIIEEEINRVNINKIPKKILSEIKKKGNVVISPLKKVKSFTEEDLNRMKSKKSTRCVLLQPKKCEKYPFEFLLKVGKKCNQDIPKEKKDIRPLDLGIKDKKEFCDNLKKFEMFNKPLIDMKKIKIMIDKNTSKKFPSIFKLYMNENTLYRGGYLKYPLRVFYFTNEFKDHPYVDIYNKKQISWYYNEDYGTVKFSNKEEIINSLKKTKKRYLIFFITVKSIYTSHSLIFLIDKKEKQFFLIDPSSTAFYEEFLNDELLTNIKKLLGKNYEARSDLDLCPIFSISTLNRIQKKALGGEYLKKKLLDPNGLCAIYTSFIIDTFIRQETLNFEDFNEKLHNYILQLGSKVILYDILINFHAYVTDRVLVFLRKDNLRRNPRVQSEKINSMIESKNKKYRNLV